MKKKTTCIEGDVSGDHNQIGNHHEVRHCSCFSWDDLIKMVEERFQHVVAKDAQIEAIFDENRKLTDELIRQNADFRLYNEAYRRQAMRIQELTDKLLDTTKLYK